MSIEIDIRKLVSSFEKSVILSSIDPCEQTEEILNQDRQKLLAAVKSLEAPTVC